MATNDWLNIDRTQLRPGQRDAIDTILRCVREGKRNIAIVLPPGYGKSDVIRVSAVMLMLQQRVSRALVLEPAENLRGQIVNRDMMQAATDRYNLPPVIGARIHAYEAKDFRLPFPPTRHRDAAFISMTIQLANGHAAELVHWVQREQRTMHCPPIIFVDEAHTGSTRNEWGNTVRALREAGAFTVLLTGTPYRSDNRQIEGFDSEVESTRPVRLARPRQEGEERLVDIYEGNRTILRLSPDFEYTLRQSWDVDNPPALCKITRLAYDFDLHSFDPVTNEHADGATLSSLTSAQLGGRLGTLLREERVMAFFADVLATQLRLRQEDARESAAIVFVGNDRREEDEESNHCARRFVDILGQIDPRLRCVIATSVDSRDGARALERFQRGDGDVLVVKQMGAVGYDVPRLKVEVDLSSVRKPGPYVQKVARVARVWRRSEDPNDVHMTAIYITPADVAGAALWQQFIADQNGETTLTNVEYVRTIQAREPVAPPFPPVYTVDGVRDADFYSDSDMRQSPTETLPIVRRVIGALPPLERLMTLPSVEQALPALRRALGLDNDGAPQNPNGAPQNPNGAPQNPPDAGEGHATVVVDGNAEQRADQEEINGLARQVATRRLGRPYRPPNDRAFGDTVRDVMYQHKATCGFPNKRPRDYTLGDVAALRASLREELESYDN